MEKFWLWLTRFAYGKLKKPYANAYGKLPVGIPGMRDPENKCSAYTPRKKRPFDSEMCDGDGHFLCKECCLYSGKWEREANDFIE